MKKIKITLLVCFTALLVGAPAMTSAQTRSGQENLRNRISVSYGDALYTTFAYGLFDVMIGGMFFRDHADDVNSAGSFWLGYRRMSESGRWAYGGDLGYYGITETRKGVKSTLNFYTVMAGAECYYLKSGIVRLYGSLDAGVAFTPEAAGFSFQFDPIGLRVGNDRIAGFAAVGYGMKGLFNLGLSVGF